MKKITYNPTNAISVLLAAVLLGKNPGLEVKTTNAKGTDFESKLEEEGAKTGYALTLLKDEHDTPNGSALEHAIVANHHDISEFGNQMLLKKVFEGNKDVINKLISQGTSITNYKSAPVFSTHVDEYNAAQAEESENEEEPSGLESDAVEE